MLYKIFTALLFCSSASFSFSVSIRFFLIICDLSTFMPVKRKPLLWLKIVGNFVGRARISKIQEILFLTSLFGMNISEKDFWQKKVWHLTKLRFTGWFHCLNWNLDMISLVSNWIFKFASRTTCCIIDVINWVEWLDP